MERRLFALDHNFPEPLLEAVMTAVPAAELVPVREIDPKLADMDDWGLLLSLHRHARPWDGLVTNDRAMLSLPKELAVLRETKLTLVVTEGEGHNPVRATGVLLCHLGHVCRLTRRDRAQVWVLRVARKDPEPPERYLERIAAQRKTTVEALLKEHAVTDGEPGGASTPREQLHVVTQHKERLVRPIVPRRVLAWASETTPDPEEVTRAAARWFSGSPQIPPTRW